MLAFCALDRKPEIPIYELFVDRGYFWLNWFGRERALDRTDSFKFFANNFVANFTLLQNASASIKGDDPADLFNNGFAFDFLGDPDIIGNGEAWDYSVDLRPGPARGRPFLIKQTTRVTLSLLIV
jgi:hypothetical protein